MARSDWGMTNSSPKRYVVELTVIQRGGSVGSSGGRRRAPRGVLRLFLAVCTGAILLLCRAALAQSSDTLVSDIPAQSLTQALATCARQTGLQIVYMSGAVRGRQSKGAQAGLTASAALTQLLEGTGLRFEFLNDRTVRIFPTPAVTSTDVATAPAKRRRAEAVPGASLEEVTVTATRREEQVNRVPISMAVWTQQSMEASGVKGMAQLGALTPGVDFNFRISNGGDLYTVLGIRGVISRFGAVASFYLDDSAIPAPRMGTYFRSYPYTFDLDRVEVLRGPQSTLLGDHTQAGAIKFFINQPSLTEFSGFARTEWGTTAHGGMSYELGVAAGGPIVKDVLGYRVSGWYREEGGYVDRVDPFTYATVDANANRSAVKMVRGALTFAPDDGVRFTPSLTYQSTSNHDSSTFFLALSNPSSGDFRNAYLIQQPFNDSYYLASLKVTADLPNAELSSLTSYLDRTLSGSYDFTPFPVTSIADAGFWYPAIAQWTFAQELRLTSVDPNAALTWNVGAFYSHDHTHHTETVGVVGRITGPSDALHVRQTELDGFGQIALKVSRHLTVSGGLRIGQSQYDYVTEPVPTFQGANSDTWTAPRFVLSYQADEHSLYYFAAAMGYGSPSLGPGLLPFTPYQYPSSTLWSYEIGSKKDLWGGRAHVDASVFHIHWNDGQVDSNPEVVDFPGPADSNGFDLAVHAQVTERLSLALEAEYADTRFTRTLMLGDAVLVRKGDVLRGSPWSAVASIERSFLLGDDLNASVRFEDAYRTNQRGPVDPQISTNVLNIRASFRRSRFDTAIFVSNALNSHRVYDVLTDSPGPPEPAQTLTPRTIGVSGTWRF
jgi:iron complex outermembrane recepter protein